MKSTCSVLINDSQSEELEYSFFAAGHTYGNPLEKANNRGLYKPFKEKIDFLNNQEKIEFGVLLGDVVWVPKFWPEAQKDIEVLNMPIHIARGNHDGPLKPFERMFGKSFKSFTLHKDLFIILDPNIDNWNISGEQLSFLKETLALEGDNARNIFVFSHQLLWWSKDKSIKPRPNSINGRDEEINFWNEIMPLFKSINKNTIFFAGDVGAFSTERRKANHIIEYGYFNEDNITFIATGMGGGVRDNLIITDITNKGVVSFRLINLNDGNESSFGKLVENNNNELV